MTIVTKPVNCTTHVGQKHMQPCGEPQYIGESKHVVNYIILFGVIVVCANLVTVFLLCNCALLHKVHMYQLIIQ